MGRSWLLTGARVVTDDKVLEPGYVHVEGGRIAAVGEGEPPADALRWLPTVDLRGRWLVPGFVDLHVHGGGGGDFMAPDPEAHRRAARFHARHGTTALLATTVTASPEALETAVQALAGSVGGDTGGARILGIHLEGPYLSVERRGAQNPRWIRDPDAAELARMLAVGAGSVLMVTLAPERPGALELVRRATAEGVVVAAGHTDATYDVIVRAVEAGLRHAIHTYNGMRGLHHREPGALGAVLDLAEVTCEVIADGLHVHPAAVRLLHRAKGTAGTVLVTDAVAPTGMPDGDYLLGDLPVRLAGGISELAGQPGTLAGSTLTMDAAVRHAVAWLGVTLPEAVRMAASNPARVLGLEGRLGRIAPGCLADMVALDEDLRVWGTMVGGRWVYGPEVTAGGRGGDG